MKKFLTALMITVISSSAAFANAIPVNKDVLKTFNSNFSTAVNVTWSEIKSHGIYHATFSSNGAKLEAFISKDGEMLASTKQIDKKQLPLSVTASLQDTYSKAFIDGNVIEYTANGEVFYYVTVITDKSTLVVQSTSEGSLSVYKKQKTIAS